MPIAPKVRKDLPDPEATIFNAAEAAEIETRTTDYADTIVTELGKAFETAFQPKDEDLTKIAAVPTTTLGRSLLSGASSAELRSIINAPATAELAAEITAREAAIQVRVEAIAREGAPEKFWPALAGFKLFKTQALVPAANSGHLLRWEPPRNMTLRGVSFCTTAAATNNDECAVVLKDTDGKTTLAKSAATAGVLNAAVSRKDVDFTGDVAVTGGHVYYLGFQYGTVGGTAASLLSIEVNNGNSVGGIWGTSPGTAYVGSATPTFPWATETAFSTASQRVYLIARER